jgi:diguanylate cyclase (GGDEF)-like protein/PAS domain S-box-containing protein
MTKLTEMKKISLLVRYIIMSAILLSAIITVGWFTTGYLGNLAREDVAKDASAALSAISIHLIDEMKKVEGAVKALAGSPWISPALLSPNDRNRERANSVLDRYNAALEASVTYLMDIHGTTIASSNRKYPDSFVGKSYRFRPYFTQAREGKQGRYFALGVTSLKKGFYASSPVMNSKGTAIGVAVMKRDLDEIEHFLRQHPYSFFVNEDGVIFLSGKAELSLKCLWPMDKIRKDALIASRQFGMGPFETVMSTKPVEGTTVIVDGRPFLFSRELIGTEGWSLILLMPADRITVYRSVGVITTVSLCLLIGGFFLILTIRERSVIKTQRSAEILREEKNKAQMYLEIAGVMMVAFDANHRVSLINRRGCEILGYDENEIIGKNWFDYFLPERVRDSTKIIFEGLMRGEIESYENVENVVLTKSGEEKLIAWHNTVLKDAEGNTTGTMSSGLDITERKKAEEEVKRLNQQIEFILGATKTGLDIIDTEFNIRYIDPEWKKVYGNPEGKKCYEYFMDRKEVCPGCGIVKALSTKEITVTEEILVKEGNRPIQVTTIPFQDSNGEWLVAEINVDITERKKAEELVRKMAYHDAVTGIPNRRLFYDRLNMAIEHSKRYTKKIAVMILDLDKFKEINDAMGHDVGDSMLKGVSGRLKGLLRTSDTVARMGGDEFALLLTEITGKEGASAIAERILLAFREPFMCNGQFLSITTSIGIALYPDHGENIETLLKHADTAMYQAKERGRNTYVCYTTTQ